VPADWGEGLTPVPDPSNPLRKSLGLSFFLQGNFRTDARMIQRPMIQKVRHACVALICGAPSRVRRIMHPLTYDDLEGLSLPIGHDVAMRTSPGLRQCLPRSADFSTIAKGPRGCRTHALQLPQPHYRFHVPRDSQWELSNYHCE